MRQYVVRIVAVLCVVAVGVWAFMRSQRPDETTAPVATTAAAPENTTQKLFQLPPRPASSNAAAGNQRATHAEGRERTPLSPPRRENERADAQTPLPTTVYRAGDFRSAEAGEAGKPAGDILLTSANEPQPLPPGSAAPLEQVNPLRSTPFSSRNGENARTFPSAGAPANPLRDSDVRQASDERPAGANGASPALRIDAAENRDPQTSPASPAPPRNLLRAATEGTASARPYPASSSSSAAQTAAAAPRSAPAGANAFQQEVATRSGVRESSGDGVRLEAYSPPAKMPTASASARALSASARPSDSSAKASESAAAEGAGQPGKKEQEGPQSPQVSIQKFAPAGVQVGKPAVFRVAVRNTGAISAHGVEVRDQIPKGTQLIATKPRAQRGASGELVWELGTLKSGDEATVEMEVMPVAEGELGSVAAVRFNAEATARTVATKPEITLKTAAANQVLIGEDLALSIVVSNPGSGPAHNVVLTERIPAGLQHPAGPELEYQVGTLKPGEQKQIQLSLTAVQAGKITNVLSAHGEGNLRTEDRREVEVIAPRLDVSMEGPRRRFLEREATYVVAIANNGSAAAKQVELTAYLPRGLKFVSANNAGQYDAGNQTVRWTLAELPASDADKVELVTLPIEAGEHKLRLEGKAEKGLSVEKEQAVVVDGIAAIKFEVVDTVDPIEKDGETVYEIRVVNQGSKTANNVRITAMVPAGMQALAAEGPTRFVLDANRVQFESLARLAPKAETSYRVRVKGVRPGDLRVRVQLLTDEMQEPVTKEESTRVYADE